MPLTFRWDDVRMLINESELADAHHPFYGLETGPGLWLVGDRGVYLMSNALFPDERLNKVIFADECNPEKMEFSEWWESKCHMFGEEDGVEFIPFAAFESSKIQDELNLSIIFSEDKVQIEILHNSDFDD